MPENVKLIHEGVTEEDFWPDLDSDDPPQNGEGKLPAKELHQNELESFQLETFLLKDELKSLKDRCNLLTNCEFYF